MDPQLPEEPTEPAPTMGSSAGDEVAVGRGARHGSSGATAKQGSVRARKGPGIAMAIGGFAVLAGSLWLPWITITLQPEALGAIEGEIGDVPLSGSLDALHEGWPGQTALACGLLLLILGVVSMTARRSSRAIGVIAIVAGLTAAGVAGYAAVSVQDRADAKTGAGFDERIAAIEVPAELDDTIAEVRELLLEAYSVKPGLGLWLALAGGGIGLVAGILAVRTVRSAPTGGAGFDAGLDRRSST